MTPDFGPALRAAAPCPDPEFAASVLKGLSSPRKSLPCKYFYDARGSELFEQITKLPEYYLPRAEISILKAHAAELVRDLPESAVLIEFGSGLSRKTEILLAHMQVLSAYVPIDVSQDALARAKKRLESRFPLLDVHALEADFCQRVLLPPAFASCPKLGFFPGSTIGNFSPSAAAGLLRNMRETLSPEGRIAVGVDLKKDPRTLICAYNDSAGITAAFNLNLLTRINSELEGNFDLDAFCHEAIYNPREGRIEMHLIAKKNHAVSVLCRRFWFAAGETIHTENSYKYSPGQFQELARLAGWQPVNVWLDEQKLFSVHELRSLT